MTFEQLQYFISIVEHDTFFDAAEDLHISQSALSKQIMRLEKDLDLKLFDRSRQKACLTDAGTAFYPEAVSLYQNYQHMLSRMKPYKSRPDALRIGTLPILTQYGLTHLFLRFENKYPDIPVILEEVEEPDLLQGLSDKRYDMVAARGHMLSGQSYETFLIAEDELSVVLPADHPLALNRCPVTLQDLAEESLILMNPYTSIYQLCMQLFKKENIRPHIVRTARTESILSAVSVKEGISLLPKSNFKIFHYENIALLPLHPAVTLPVVLVMEKGQNSSKNTALFLSFIKIEQSKQEITNL